MSINIGDNFSYLGKKFLDAREHFNTLAEMKACNDVPNGFITYCDETKTRYEYHSDNQEDATLGKWTVFKSVPDVNFDDYVTQDELEEAIKDVDVTSQLENYATKEYVDNAIDDVDVTEQLQDYAKKTDVPTKVSQLENDKGYLTEHQDISNLALKSELHNHENKSLLDAITSGDITKWSQSIPFNDTYVSDCNAWLTNGYIKTGAGQTANLPSVCTGSDRWGILFFIAENVTQGTGTQMYFPIDGTYKGRIFTRSLTNMNQSPTVGEWNLISTFSGNYNDLTNKPTIPTVPTNISAFNNDSGYLTSIPSEYVTDNELNSKGYLTEHQDISHLATKDYVDQAIEDVDVTEQLQDYALKSEIPTKTSELENDSDYTTKTYVDEVLQNIDLSEYAKLTDLDGLFDDVALNEQETTENQTAIDFYSNGKVVQTVYFTGGSGGGSATSAYISTTLEENVMVGTGEDFNLVLDFASPNLGKGTLKVFINDKDSLTTSIGQGESTTPIRGDLFSKGQNQVVVYVLDRVGVMSNSLTFYVRYGSLEIESDFDAYSSYDYGSVVRYYFTPTAVDTSLALTMYMSIDGQTQTGVSCTSDTRGYYTFPSNLSVGNHLCKAWVQDSNGTISNILVFNLIILDATSLVVATDTHDTVSIEEGEQLSLDYKVYMKGNSTFNVKVYVDNNLVSTGTCGLTTSYYKTSSLSLGLHTVKVEVFDVMNTVSDYVTWTVNITESSYQMKEPVTAGATFIASAKNKSNQDENKEVWIGTNQDGDSIEVPLQQFSWNEESGWINDQLIFSGNSYAEVPIKPLVDNAKYGFTLDIEFLTKPIGVEDALVLDLWDEVNNCGIKITTEELIMQSKAGNRCDLYFEEDTIVSAIFVIDRNEGTAKIYLDGVMCEAFHLTDYEVGGEKYLEDFTVDKNIKLGGKGYCAIRNIRTYQVALTTDEIINNFIANKIVKSEQRALVEFQKGNDLPTMTIYCDFSGLGKDDKKPCNIVYNSPDTNKYGESFNIDGKYSQLQYQGTSSMAYPIKNYRINPRDKNGKKKINPFNGGKPESRFTLKADFITSNHAHNTGMAKFISDNLYNYNNNDEKTMNPMRWYLLQNGEDVNTVRETINGFPIKLILVNNGSTQLNAGQAEPTPGNTKDMGIFNFNNDKDNLNTMGMDTKIFPNCISYEVTANSDTSAGAFVPYHHDYIFPYYKITGIDGNNAGQYYDICPIAKAGYAGEVISITDIKNTKGITVYHGHANGNYGSLIAGSDKNADDFSFTCPTNTDYLYLLFYVYTDWSATDDYASEISFKFNGVPVVLEKQNSISTYTELPIKIDENKELEYLQNSFELRYPDEDDVGKDYGYLGMMGDVVHSILDYNGNHTTHFIIDNLGDTITFNDDVGIDYWDSTGKWVMYRAYTAGTTINRRDIPNYYYMGIGIEQLPVSINETKYYLGNEVTEVNKEPYEKIIKEFSTDYGLKRVIDWVGNATKEEFLADFDKYFNRHYTLRYYLLVVLMAGVDKKCSL